MTVLHPQASERRGWLSQVRRVRVGSANEPKISAVRAALAAFVADVEVEGVAVESGVSEQPVGFEEIAEGARNRARGAMQFTGGAHCDLGFGIEDGLVELSLDGRAEVLNIGCAVVTDGRHESIGLSAGFAYPAGCTVSALAGREDIGSAFDRLWHNYAGADEATPSGRGTGNIGMLTLGALPRSEYGRHAVLCALVRFLHPSLYFGSSAVGEAISRTDVAGRGFA